MTDVIPMHALLFQARRDLDAALSDKEQAERAQHDAEEVARRAEERATKAEDDRDGWAGFAHALAHEHLINQHADERLSDNSCRAITDHLYDIWSTGTPIDDLGVAAVVNDYNEAIR